MSYRKKQKNFKRYRLYNRNKAHAIKKVIPVIIGTKRTTSKPSRKHLSNRSGEYETAQILLSDLQGA
jgi:hypothetical protein